MDQYDQKNVGTDNKKMPKTEMTPDEAANQQANPPKVNEATPKKKLVRQVNYD